MDKKKTGDSARGALTEAQRALVRDNMGLVAVHLRRFVPNLGEPRRDREWEDLFQEGCIGLIRAATTYRPERRIPFAAYALPRIHNAVSRALQRRFSTIHTPRRRSRRAGDKPPGRSTEDSPRVRTCSLSDELAGRIADRRRHDPSADHAPETETPSAMTIGQRLREKYERAVRQAGTTITTRTSTRGDRDELIRLLTKERFLVPREESRRALRQIARDTRSSYARVAQCEKRLADAIRAALEADPEFGPLQRYARRDPIGTDAPIDSTMEGELTSACTREFIRRFGHADRDRRSAMLVELLEMSPGGVEELVRARIPRLAPSMRERLLTGSQSRNRK